MQSMLAWALQTTCVVALLIPLVMLLCRLFHYRPAVQHALWTALLIKMLVPPLVSFPIPWQTSAFVPTGTEVKLPSGSSPGSGLESPLPQRDDPFSELRPLSANEEGASQQQSGASHDSVNHENLFGDDANKLTQTSPQDSTPTAAESKRPNKTETDLSLRSKLAETGLTHTAESLGAKEEGLRKDKEAFGGLRTALLRHLPWMGCLVWGLGSLVVLGRQFGRVLRQHAKLRSAERAPEELLHAMQSVAAKLGVPPCRVRVKADLSSPFIWCFGKTTLVWPSGVPIGAVDAERVLAILAHEMAHVARRDHWVAWLEMAADALWWWSPLYRVVRANVRTTADMACDTLALDTYPEHRGAYAAALLRLSIDCKKGTPELVLAVGSGGPTSLERRLLMIASEKHCSKWGWPGLFALACVALVMAPSWSAGQSKTTTTAGGGIPSSSTLNATSEQERPDSNNEDSLQLSEFEQKQLAVYRELSQVKDQMDAFENGYSAKGGTPFDTQSFIHRVDELMQKLADMTEGKPEQARMLLLDRLQQYHDRTEERLSSEAMKSDSPSKLLMLRLNKMRCRQMLADLKGETVSASETYVPSNNSVEINAGKSSETSSVAVAQTSAAYHEQEIQTLRMELERRTAELKNVLAELDRFKSLASQQATAKKPPKLLRVFNLRSAEANDVLHLMQNLDSLEGPVRLAVDPRTNSIIAAGPESEQAALQLDAIADLIEQVDRQTAAYLLEKQRANSSPFQNSETQAPSLQTN